MRLILVLLGVLLLPPAAQAVVVVHYDAIEMQCRSIQRCNARADCASDVSYKTVVRLSAETYTSSFSPFAKRREKWTRSLSYDEFGAKGATRHSTYRTLSKVTDSAGTYRKASFEERQDGWFGPELPDSNQPHQERASTYVLYHTRTLETAGKGLFQNNERQIITFQCEETG